MVVRGIKHMDITNYIYQAEKLGVFSSQELKNIIEFDSESSMLGEVALVDYNSKISASNVLFYETLYDENASCHISL